MNKYCTILRDTPQLIDQLRDLVFEGDFVLATSDVQALYTNIPLRDFYTILDQFILPEFPIHFRTFFS